MTQRFHCWEYTLRTLKHQFKRIYAVKMFTAVLFTIAKCWKQPKCSSVDEQIKNWYICTMEYYPAERKKEVLPFAPAWMKLETIMISEIS